MLSSRLKVNCEVCRIQCPDSDFLQYSTLSWKLEYTISVAMVMVAWRCSYFENNWAYMFCVYFWKKYSLMLSFLLKPWISSIAAVTGAGRCRYFENDFSSMTDDLRCHLWHLPSYHTVNEYAMYWVKLLWLMSSKICCSENGGRAVIVAVKCHTSMIKYCYIRAETVCTVMVAAAPGGKCCRDILFCSCSTKTWPVREHCQCQ